MQLQHLQLGGLCERSALFLAHASNAAYRDDPKTYVGYDRFQFDDVLPFHCPSKVTHGFLASKKDAIVLAFRGTDDIMDWCINIDSKQIEDKGARIHKGFFHAVDSVWVTLAKTYGQ
ncbi:MAG TPA: hypothetical protein DEB39_12765 [Planctomycetaceae bacterium]|nr:hypothetical protein [Planctomycetaceae bacterium]